MSSGSDHSIGRRVFVERLVAGVALAATGACSTPPQPSSSAGWPAASESSSIELENAPSPIVDSHIHAVPCVPNLKQSPAEREKLLDAPAEAIAPALQAEMNQAGIGRAFGMGCLNGGEDDPLGIDKTIRLAGLVRGIQAIGALDPRRTDRHHLRLVERQLNKERALVVGFKAYLGYVRAGPADPGYEPYYKLAAKYSLPVIFHTGDTWSKTAKLRYAHPIGVDDVAADHPEVRFVIAHFGNPWFIDAAEVIYKNDNVWADLSGLYVGDDKSLTDLLKQEPLPSVGSGVLIGELRNALAYAERPERLLYGTDWPLVSMPVYRRFIEAILPKENHQMVFRNNAEALFGPL